MKEQFVVSVGIKEMGGGAIVFERKYMRKGMIQAAREVKKEGKRLVNSRAVSKPGEAPGRKTGTLFKSIDYDIGSRGLYAVVKPYKDAGFTKSEFYPAFLHHGVHWPPRRKDHSAHPVGTPFRVMPRSNYLKQALENSEDRVRQVILEAVKRALQA